MQGANGQKSIFTLYTRIIIIINRKTVLFLLFLCLVNSFKKEERKEEEQKSVRRRVSEKRGRDEKGKKEKESKNIYARLQFT